METQIGTCGTTRRTTFRTRTETDRKAGDETLEFATSSIEVLVKLEPSDRSGFFGKTINKSTVKIPKNES